MPWLPDRHPRLLCLRGLLDTKALVLAEKHSHTINYCGTGFYWCGFDCSRVHLGHGVDYCVEIHRAPRPSLALDSPYLCRPLALYSHRPSSSSYQLLIHLFSLQEIGRKTVITGSKNKPLHQAPPSVVDLEEIYLTTTSRRCLQFLFTWFLLPEIGGRDENSNSDRFSRTNDRQTHLC